MPLEKKCTRLRYYLLSIYVLQAYTIPTMSPCNYIYMNNLENIINTVGYLQIWQDEWNHCTMPFL